MYSYRLICYLDQINPCDAIPCLNGATCAPLTGLTYNCQCDTGFNGANCEISKYSLDLDKINPCDANLCLNGATCATLIGLTNNCTVNVILALTEQT